MIRAHTILKMLAIFLLMICLVGPNVLRMAQTIAMTNISRIWIPGK